MNRPTKDFQKKYIPDRCDPLIEAATNGDLSMKGLSRYNYPGQGLPDSVLTGVCSIGYWDAKIDQSWGLDWHRNEGIEFTFLESGNLYFSTEKEQLNLDPGSFTITRPWQLHKVGAPNVTIGKLYWLIIDVGVKQPHQAWEWPSWIILAKEDLDYLTKILRQNDVCVWKTDKKLSKCFIELGRCLDNSELEIPHSKLCVLINDLLLEMLCLFKRGHMELDLSLIQNLRTVEVFLEYLRNNFEKFWTLEDMAEHCGLGKTSLSKYCKQLTNMSPVNYLINIRLEAAVKLLSCKDLLNITSVCYECGFSSSQYFATTFKKRYHWTPSEYRERFMNKTELSYVL